MTAKPLSQCCLSVSLSQGSGLFYDDLGNSYDGEWQAGLRHGRGRSVTGGRPVDGFGGDVYEGSWEHDVK
jgi:hypothetical protein